MQENMHILDADILEASSPLILIDDRGVEKRPINFVSELVGGERSLMLSNFTIPSSQHDHFPGFSQEERVPYILGKCLVTFVRWYLQNLVF